MFKKHVILLLPIFGRFYYVLMNEFMHQFIKSTPPHMQYQKKALWVANMPKCDKYDYEEMGTNLLTPRWWPSSSCQPPPASASPPGYDLATSCHLQTRTSPYTPVESSPLGCSLHFAPWQICSVKHHLDLHRMQSAALQLMCAHLYTNFHHYL